MKRVPLSSMEFRGNFTWNFPLIFSRSFPWFSMDNNWISMQIPWKISGRKALAGSCCCLCRSSHYYRLGLQIFCYRVFSCQQRWPWQLRRQGGEGVAGGVYYWECFVYQYKGANMCVCGVGVCVTTTTYSSGMTSGLTLSKCMWKWVLIWRPTWHHLFCMHACIMHLYRDISTVTQQHAWKAVELVLWWTWPLEGQSVF